MKYLLLIVTAFFLTTQSFAQETFIRKDSLQGGLRFERTCFDVLEYDLNIKINPDEKYISGSNWITFKVVENTKRIQIDLFENMKVDSIFILNKPIKYLALDSIHLPAKKLNYQREYNAVFVDFPEELEKGSTEHLAFYYSGKPLEAKNAPWDGGFVWKKDNNGKIKSPTYKYADWGIMGLAYCPGNSCIVSTFRIKHPDKQKHFTRLKKVAVHEFGHNLGLPHCPDKSCVMTDAVESVATIDNAQLALCKACTLKLK